MPQGEKFKALFETPQKARLTVICALVALATVGAVIAYIVYSLAHGADAPPMQSEAVSDTPAVSEVPGESALLPTPNRVGIVPALTIDEARALALADAGVSEDEADVSREVLAEDNGIWVYEFLFRTETARYEYQINANSGEVRGMIREVLVSPGAGTAEPSAPPAESAPPAADASQPPDAEQSPDAAQPSDTAQPSDDSPAADTPAPSPAADTSAPSPTPDQPASMYIGIDRAKTAALDHAGLSADQAAFTRVRMTRMDGTMIYELRFRQGRTEYEYRIDAATGRVLEHSQNGN